MAITQENKSKLTINDRGISFPINNDTPPQPRDEVSTFNITRESAESELVWSPKTTDAASLGTPTVIFVGNVSSDLIDSDLILTIDTQTQSVHLSGFYGFDSFPNVTYKFKNTDYTPSTLDSPPDLSSPIIPGEAPPEAIISGSGLPLPFNNKYFNSLFEIKIDPTLTRDYNYSVDFIVEFDYSSLSIAAPSTITNNDSPETYQLYVDTVGQKAYRKDRFVFNQTVRNFTGEQIGSLLRTAIQSSKYKEVNYVPHVMYHPTTGKAFNADTYSQHVAYANLGYIHNYPQQ
tara:strand:- start:1842 stop:2708 length:867 start_codon:yes stop_codon:yes gene_type:complete